MIGPPKVAPNWCWERSAFFRPARLLNQLLASKASLRVELEHAAVVLVRPALELQVDDAAQRSAELGGVRARLELELLERVDAREDDHGLEPGLVVVDAVEHVVVVARPLPVRRERGRGAPGQAAGPVDVAPRRAAQDAGHGPGQAHEVPAVERQGLDLLLDDGRAELGGRGLEERRLGLDLDHLGHGADLEGQVDADLLVDAQLHVGLRHLLEARELGGDGVGAGGDEGGRVLSGRVAHDAAAEARARVHERHRRARHDRPGRVLDEPQDRAADGLGSGRRRGEAAQDGEACEGGCENPRSKRQSAHIVSSHVTRRVPSWKPLRAQLV